MNRIREAVVVEGRDDTAAVKRAVDAVTIETHGYGISADTWKEIERAAGSCGIIVFTDPDHAGEEIRRRIKERFPGCKEAFLTKGQAEKEGDIGIENAEPSDIEEALLKARAEIREGSDTFTMKDMQDAGLAAGAGSRGRRTELAKALGIGYGNAAAMLGKLNGYGISREEFHGALRSTGDQSHKE